VSTPDGRQHPRYAHEAAITLIVKGGKAIQGRTQNVSRGGLCADLAEPIAPGTELQVDLQLVFENEEHSDALRVPARVAWCTPVDEGHQVGLAFKPLDAERTKYLGMFLRFLDGEARVKNDKRRDAPVDEKFG
jgi:Tfp pilus assembly protein PilZ